MVWDFGTKPAAPSALDPNAPDPRYGGNVQNQVENPAWLAWNEQQNRYKSDIRKMQGVPGYENHIAYTQQLLEQGWANEPPRYTQTALGQDVQNVRDQGAQAVTNLATARDNQLQTGQDAYDSGRQAAAAASTQAGAAQGRTGPTLDVQGRARDAQKGAANAAIDFQAPQVGQHVAGVSGAHAANIAGQQAAGGGAAGIRSAGEQGAQDLSSFRSPTSGISALNRFAQGPAGPSAAEAMLRLQAARDKATALSRARSVRGGPGAVAEAMKTAQAEGAAISADTRGQAALTRATEAAAARQQSLQALSAAGGLEQQASQTQLGALTAGSQLSLQGQQAATAAELQASQQNLQAAIAAGELATQGATAAGQLDLGASQQNLQAVQLRADIANNMRAMDIDQAKAQLGADLQQLAMNDEQTRFFAGLSEQARQDANHTRLQASQQGLNADIAAANVGLQYATQAWAMLTTEQQAEIQRMAIERGVVAANQANAAAERQQTMQFFATLLTAGGMAASDRRAKHDVRRLRSMAAALRGTPGSSYRYKDPKRHGKGEFTGPMAQDLEKTREFRSAVKEVGGVKMVDTGRLALAHHAALSDLQRQIDRLEKLGRRKGAAA